LITITFTLLIGLLGLGMPVAFAIMASSFAYFFFVAALLFVLLLITYIPWLVLFLPNLIMG
jgi:hypothetical protein